MKFWRFSTNSGAPPAESPPAEIAAASTAAASPAISTRIVSEQELAALDQLATVLRIWGKFAFDLDDRDARSIAHELEFWARHVLVRPFTSPADAEALPPGRRDWQGLRDFVTGLRQGEREYVVRQIGGARSVIGDFLQTLGGMLADDQDEQARVKTVVERLRQVIEKNAPLEMLRQEAMGAIEQIGAIAREREERHKRTLHELTEKLQSLRGELSTAQREMELDPLTRLYNRKSLDQHLQRVFELSRLSGQSATLLMVDADHFKTVNDRFGHQVGDLVLRKLADCCVQSFPRKSDFVARYGGEEFAVVLQETPLHTAVQLAERLLVAVRAMEIATDQGPLRITLSMGAAGLRKLDSLEQWVESADQALYRAKQSGRDRILCAPS